MASGVPYIFSPATIIYSAETNANNAFWGSLIDSTVSTTSVVRVNTSTHQVSITNTTNTESFNILVGTNTDLLVTTGNLHVYDTDHDVHLRIYADDLGPDYVDIWHDGTNGNLETGSGDLLIEPSGGDVMFRSGTDVRVYNAANTQYGLNAMGTNWDFSTTSGEITMNPFATFRVTAGSDIVFTPTGDVYITAGASLMLRNPADTAETGLYTDVNNDLQIVPNANGDVIVFNKEPRLSGSYFGSNGSATYQNVFRQTGWGYVEGDGVTPGALSVPITFIKAFSAGTVRVLINFIGTKTTAGAPTSESSFVVSSSALYIANVDSITSTGFTASLGQYDLGTLSTDYFGFNWEAIGPI